MNWGFKDMRRSPGQYNEIKWLPNCLINLPELASPIISQTSNNFFADYLLSAGTNQAWLMTRPPRTTILAVNAVESRD